MRAQELIDLLEQKIKTYGNLEIYRPLNEEDESKGFGFSGCNHCTVSNVGVMQRENEWECDDDGVRMPMVFFKIDQE